MKKVEEEKIINENQMAIIFNVPTNTIKLEVIATLMDKDDTTYKATSSLNIAELYEARILGDEWEAENVKYVLTDKGREVAYDKKSV